MSLSDDCASHLHEYCNICECACHNLVSFTDDELKALKKALEHQYFSYSKPHLHSGIDKILKLARSREDEEI